jgi:PKD repeat protein
MATPLVVGTGVGLTAEGQHVIQVFTEKPGASLPRALDGVPVEVEVTGMFVARSDPTTKFDRPVPIGVSTGHPDITAGTIGARVKDAQGNVYALSNNHVYANTNDAQFGDSALQPGPYDGGTDPQDKIGELYDFEPIKFDGSNNTIDAAIASSTTDLLGYSTPSDGYGTPSSIATAASLRLAVQKFGRTTGLTDGEVSQINATVDVCYESKCNPVRCICRASARFVDQIVIAPGDFSAGGDSGSLIVTDDGSNSPVGLLFAGSATHTIANPIDLVLDRFNVTIDDGSTGGENVPPTAGFAYTSDGLTVDFTDQSMDSDGSVVAWDWDFGDGNNSAEQNPSHTYAADGTYAVTLTVTDDGDATDSVTKDVTVSSGGGITLTATAYKYRGLQKADLEWSGATSTDVEVYRDSTLIATTGNDGFYTDNIDQRGGGSYTYQVCEAGTSTCSNEATVNF